MYVTVAQAVQHLRLPIVLGQTPIDPIEQEVTDKLTMAEAIIVDYLKQPTVNPLMVDPTVTPDWVISAAVLLELGELWRFRGDDQFKEGPEHDLEIGQLSPTITNLLRRHRDPALAAPPTPTPTG